MTLQPKGHPNLFSWLKWCDSGVWIQEEKMKASLQELTKKNGYLKMYSGNLQNQLIQSMDENNAVKEKLIVAGEELKLVKQKLTNSEKKLREATTFQEQQRRMLETMKVKFENFLRDINLENTQKEALMEKLLQLKTGSESRLKADLQAMQKHYEEEGMNIVPPSSSSSSSSSSSAEFEQAHGLMKFLRMVVGNDVLYNNADPWKSSTAEEGGGKKKKKNPQKTAKDVCVEFTTLLKDCNILSLPFFTSKDVQSSNFCLPEAWMVDRETECTLSFIHSSDTFLQSTSTSSACTQRVFDEANMSVFDSPTLFMLNINPISQDEEVGFDDMLHQTFDVSVAGESSNVYNIEGTSSASSSAITTTHRTNNSLATAVSNIKKVQNKYMKGQFPQQTNVHTHVGDTLTNKWKNLADDVFRTKPTSFGAGNQPLPQRIGVDTLHQYPLKYLKWVIGDEKGFHSISRLVGKMIDVQHLNGKTMTLRRIVQETLKEILLIE